MDDHKQQLLEKFEQIKSKMNPTSIKEEIANLEARTYDADFWKDSKAAADVMKRINSMKKEIEDIEMMELLLAENELKDAEKLITSYEIHLFLSGTYDKGDAIFAIHAGQGGTEAMDWTEMLFRMYTRYFEKKGWKWEEIDRVAGEEAGIKSVILNVYGNFAYGYLKAEAGVHRLVRQSPFNADKLRQTSFALVEVLPVLEQQEELDLDPKELKIETKTASGHGGQSVNTTYSAVRITHLPTGLTVSIQNERSQTQNKEQALKILKSKLKKLEEERRIQEKLKLRGEFKSAEWGNQIRSYTLHPYKLVKDHRSGYETSDAENVLEGNLEDFIEKYLES